MRSFIGKLLGAFFGALFAGPFGAFVGLLIGHQLDKRMNSVWHTMQSGQSNAQTQLVFFETTFAVMGHIAKADGRVSEQEIRMAKEIMAHMQLNAERRQQAMALFSQGKDPAFNLHQAIQRLKQNCQHAPNLLRMFFEIQVRAASADGAIRPAQQRVLQTVATELGVNWFDFSQFEQIFRHFQQSQTGGGQYQRQNYRSPQTQQPTMADCYKVLGVTTANSNDEIKRAYRKLMKDNHPDKLIAKGLPQEMIKIATEKTQRIQTAYERIRTERGIK